MLAAAPIAVTTLPAIVSAAPVDPVDAALAELMEATNAVDRVGRDAFGDSLLAWVRLCARLHDRPRAEHGAERGQRIWTEAMDRHHFWYCATHSLDPNDTGWQRP